MTWQLIITKCNSSETQEIENFQGIISCDVDTQLETFTFTIDYNIIGELTGETGFIGGETNPDVLLKMGVQVDLYHDTELWFHGFIYQDPAFTEGGINNEIQCVAYDPKYRLRKAQIPNGGFLSWAVESPRITLEEVQLVIGTGYNVGDSRTYFPSFTEGVLFDNATFLGVNDTLVADVGATITLGLVNVGFPPRGFVLIRDVTDTVNKEIVYHDGYFFNGVNWQLTNCVRVQLNGPAVATVAGDIVHSLAFKEITQSAELLELQEVGSDYIRIPYAKFTKNRLLGGYTFNRTQNGNVRGTYEIYDETDPAVLTLTDIANLFVQADRDNGGAGFLPIELNFDALALAVNTFQYDVRFYQGYALELWNKLLDDLQVNVLLYWSSAEEVMRLEFLAQQAIPDILLSDVKSIYRQRDFDDIYTGVRVIYEDEDNFSSLEEFYALHPAPYSQRDSVEGSGKNDFADHPDVWVDTIKSDDGDPRIDYKEDKAGHGVDDSDRFQAAKPFFGFPFWNTWGLNHVITDSPGELMAFWNKNFVDYQEIFDANHEWHHSYYWFSSDAEIRTLDEIKIEIGDSEYGEASVTVYGATNFDPLTMLPDDPAIDWHPVSPELTRIGGTGGNSAESFNFETQNFLFQSVNILRITYHEIPIDRKGGGDKGGGNIEASIFDFFVRANKTKELLIQVTDDVAEINNPLFIYNPAAFDRLACIYPIVDKLDGGKLSDQEAMFLGRQYMEDALARFETRDYVYRKAWTARKPRIGDTFQVDELQHQLYTGTLVNYELIINRGVPDLEVQFSLFDFNVGVIGTGT